MLRCDGATIRSLHPKIRPDVEPRRIMTKKDLLRLGPPGDNAIHVCVDMQRMFGEDTG
ncbi:hypothetical protein ACVILK_002440 [Bradyrhizobium embrapense]